MNLTVVIVSTTSKTIFCFMIINLIFIKVINISTSSQICVLINKSKLSSIKLPTSLSIFPYFDDKVLLVGASLNGGNVLQSFVDMMSSFMSNFSRETSKDQIWEKLIQLGNDSLKLKSSSTNEIKCRPVLYGERHDKQTYANISNININNLNIGNIFNSICRGLIQNLCDMITWDFLFDVIKCRRLICTGSCLTRNSILKFYLNEIFTRDNNNVEILFKSSSDSAIGAAYFIRDFYSDKK
jgi:sedoheptulokinase